MTPPALPREPERDLVLKTAVAILVVVGTNVIGNYALARGLRGVGVLESWSPLPYIRALVHPWVATGVVGLAAWMASRLVLLSWADLSFVLPVTSLSYVLSSAAGALLLGEVLTGREWAGVILISLGVALVAMTSPDRTAQAGGR